MAKFLLNNKKQFLMKRRCFATSTFSQLSQSFRKVVQDNTEEVSEKTATYKDSSGVEKLAITKKLGDKVEEMIVKTDATGKKEVVSNMSENERRDFDKQWQEALITAQGGLALPSTNTRALDMINRPMFSDTRAFPPSASLFSSMLPRAETTFRPIYDQMFREQQQLFDNLNNFMINRMAALSAPVEQTVEPTVMVDENLNLDKEFHNLTEGFFHGGKGTYITKEEGSKKEIGDTSG